jgi:phenylacetate-CoA ligase
MDYKSWLMQRYYEFRAYVPARWLYHADYFRVLQLLDSKAPPQAVADERLRHVLTTAVRHVPFYRRAVRVQPHELSNEPPLALLARFPYIGKNDVMECQRDFLDERLDPRWLVYATSTGSSGQGIGVWRSKRLGDIEKAFYVHQWARFGFSFDKSHYLRIGYDAARPAHQPPTRVSGNRLLLSPYHLSPRHKPAIVAALNAFGPRFIHAYPSCASALADLLAPGELHFKIDGVLLASEPAEPQQLAAIESQFACPVSISYGLTERTNLAFAHYAGGTGWPYRFDPLYGINENRLVAGRPEIVGTALWNDVMPLIRYCTGDYGAIDADGVCRAIEGREQEFLIDRWGNRIPGLSVYIDEASWDFVRTYQIWQKRPGAITIAVVPRHTALTLGQRRELLRGQVEHWGGLFEITLAQVPDIPLAPNGKRRFVVSELGMQGR